MPQATPELSPAERASLAILRATNENAALKRLQHLFLFTVSKAWMRKTVQRRMYVDGVDWLRDLRPERGVVLAANHRSFFDQYGALLALEEFGVKWPRRLYFPVRSDFFYERPLGVLLNLAVGGGAMYPPIFRDRAKASLNEDALDRVIHFLEHPGTLVGVHPEGTRGKGPDPYELLPAQPGIGQIILRSGAMVIPLFINGLSNDIVGELRVNYRRGARETRPLILCFGEAVDYSDLAAKKPRLVLYKRCADRVRDAIVELGRRERVLRQAIASGQVPRDDPGWFANQARAAAR